LIRQTEPRTIGDHEAIKQAIRRTLPQEYGERHNGVFELARELKAIPSLADADGLELREVVKEWHTSAVPFIQTKDFDTTWGEFLRAWDRVILPAGHDPMAIVLKEAEEAELPSFAGRYDSSDTKLLVKLCMVLQERAGNDAFFLAASTVARLVGIDQRTASRRLAMLVRERVLTVVKQHTRTRAKRYRYQGVDNES